jgi:serpin B
MEADMLRYSVALFAVCLFLASFGCLSMAPAVPQTDIQPAVEGNTAFAVDLYVRLRSQQGNLFFSPYSISTALAMTYGGARGETAQQIAKVFHFRGDAQEAARDFSLIDARLLASAKDCQLYTANALWGQKGFSFRPPFIQLNKEFFHAGLNDVDFAHATEVARQTINQWVADHTKDKIQDLLQPGVLDSTTRLVLTNAIYFKGNWAHPFDKQRTQNEDFHVSPSQTVTVPTMHDRRHFNYVQMDGLQALELPYSGDDAFSMVILLPQKPDGLAGLEQKLNTTNLTNWLRALRNREVIVSMPRFRTTVEFQLNKALAGLGMPAAFDPAKADFSGMSEQDKLFLSAVVHKAFVDVNEEGTEAAAATGAVVALASAPAEPPVFRADHPFVFLIRDRSSGSILFLGRITNPGSRS